MSEARHPHPHQHHHRSHRKHPHRIIIARGEHMRSFVLRPWLTIGMCTIAVIFGSLYIGATGYLIFRDDLLSTSMTHEARLRTAYEDRIADLRAQIDRLTSRQLLNQQAIETRMERILTRQAALDARQDMLGDLAAAARRAGVEPGTPPPMPVANPLRDGADADAADHIRGAAAGPRADAGLAGSDRRLADIESGLDAIEQRQIAYVQAIGGSAADKANRIASVLNGIGQPVPEAPDAMGGPFEPLPDEIDHEDFTGGVAMVSDQLDLLASIRRSALLLPLAHPLTTFDITSGFGRRLDPFLRRPAMHTGVDFRAPTGTAVAATAGGVVTEAGYAGGYGRMVEIDHGNGVRTRYGHLSKILVKIGDHVEAGDFVGRVGSTGRSTGPHLHYEVRIDGKAIDPTAWLTAGTRLNGLL
jgi:murein DD-endopeptidase MepM/ murein hydrolase activator NlpD